MDPSATRLMELWGEIADLDAAAEVLSWDQETMMPPGGVDGRARQLATLAGVIHQRLTDPELRDVLDACAGVADPGSELEAQVREARRRVDRAILVPADLARALAEAQSRGLAAL